MTFKQFITESEEENDVAHTLNKVPKSHKSLLKGYKIDLQQGNTLKKHNGHVGLMDPKKKLISVAAPWSYPREFTFLHELAHRVWAAFIQGTELEKEWNKIAKSTKNTKKDEPPEELWSHGYANFFANHPHVIFDHKPWKVFIQKVIDKTS